MAGLFASIGAFFTHGAVGYATLLVFSLATITGSMYVLSTRQANDVIFANARFENSAISTGAPADFRPETQVRTVIVNFEGGIATGLREAVTNLAGAIRAVSSNIIAEAQREDAARAAALAARPSAFGLSADSQLAVGGSGLPSVPPQTQATAVPPAPTTQAQPPAPPTQAPPAPTSAPTQAPPAPTAIPPTQAPPQPTAVPASPVPPTATPLPPAPTATPAPQQQSQPEATGVPSQPTAAPEQPTPIPVQATTPPIVATIAALPTVAPIATLVPTPAPVATLAPIVFDLGLSVGYQPFFTISGGMSAGEPISRDIVLQNSSSDMVAYLGTSLTGPSLPSPAPTSTPLPATPLWSDSVNGLKAKITITSGTGATQTTATRYDGPLAFSNILLGTLVKGEVYVMNVSVYLPAGIPNTLQATSQSASFVFTLIQ